MKTMTARFNGKCRCGAKVFKDDRVRFEAKKIVACETCGNFGPTLLGEDHGLGWAWGVHLGHNVDAMRRLYKMIRTAYLALPMRPEGPATIQTFVVQSERGEESKRGIVGRSCATAEDFDAAMKEAVTRETKDWGGCDEFDRLTIAQLFTLRAAQAYESAACGATWLGPSPETLEWGGFLGGERINFPEDSHPAINAMVRRAFKMAEAEEDAA